MIVKVIKIILSFLLIPVVALSMSSANYQITSDSINFGGTDQATSTNYKLDDTMGEVGTGFVYSSGYWAGIGYRQMLAPEPSISFSLSKNTINLGILSASAIGSDSHSFTVTTNAIQGYGVRVYEDGGLRSGANDIDDVTDGEVTAGSEEYGISTAGANGQLNAADTAVSNGLLVSESSRPVSSDTTTVTYKASISSGTAAGTYNQVVYYAVTGVF